MVTPNSRINRLERAQSLVEMALITPLLLIMLIGLLEVGNAIRTYQVLVTSNRETARFLARDLYEDGQGVAHGLTSASRQINLDLTDNTTIIVHQGTLEAGNPFDGDDDFYEHSYTVFGVMADPKVDVLELQEEAIRLNNVVNKSVYVRELTIAKKLCDRKGDCFRYDALMDKDFKTAPVEWTKEQYVYVETMHEMNQLFGFFGQWHIPLYVHTMMRVSSSRGF